MENKIENEIKRIADGTTMKITKNEYPIQKNKKTYEKNCLILCAPLPYATETKKKR